MTFQRRSAELRAIDNAITTWQTGGGGTPGDLDTNETQLTAIRTAVQAWRDSKTGQSTRGTFIDELATRVEAAVGEVAQRRATRARQQAELDKYRQIDPDMARFAARTRRTDALDPGNKLHEALSADRDARGRLPGQSLDMLDEIARRQLGDQLAIVGGVTPNGVTPAQVQQIMANNVNQVTGRTTYPELASFASGAKANVAETVSGYAGQKPREFVAEVFLGLVYGRTFSSDVLEMYQGLGGPKPSQRP